MLELPNLASRSSPGDAERPDRRRRPGVHDRRRQSDARLPRGNQSPRLIASGPFERLTAHTITSPAVLVQALAQVQQRGYAVDVEEHEVGVGYVAAPIFEETIGAAAISVSAPTPRTAAATPAELGEPLVDHAAAISVSLGRQTHDHAARAAAS